MLPNPSKRKNGVLLSNERDIFDRWKEYFKDLSNPVIITLPDTHEVHLRKKNNTITAAEVLKYWRLGRLQAVMKSDLKVSKHWIKEFFSWLVCQVAWCYWKTLRYWPTGVIIPIKKADKSECTKYQGISLLTASLEKCMPCTLKKDAAK